MKTHELIDTLSRQTTPAPKSLLRGRLLVSIVGGLVLGLVALKLTLGFRPDIGVSAAVVALKAGFSALLATVAMGAALKLARPTAAANAGTSAFGPWVVLACAAFLIAGISLMATSPEHRFEAFSGNGFPWCLILIPLFGLPCAVLLVWALKEAAPTRLALAGAGVGATSGGVGAIVYAMYCPVDAVPFVTIWYVIAIGISAALGAILGSRLLRW
jgi:hypothetical protein